MIEDILKERRNAHGEFAARAKIVCELKAVMRRAVGWHKLEAQHKEALDMIACKISRIVVGDADYADHWVDIQGYAKLAEKAIDNDNT